MFFHHWRRSHAFLSGLFCFGFQSLLPATAKADNQNWYESYEVVFTNPVCPARPFLGHYEGNSFVAGETIPSLGGGEVRTKTKANAFCLNADAKASALRAGSPQSKILNWLGDPNTKEVLLTAMTFSHRWVANAACDAAKRGVTVNIVLHGKSAVAEEMKANCKSEGQPVPINIQYRGGMDGLFHMKMLLINPGRPGYKIAFSSANFSAGIVLNHENWHFITLKPNTYFGEDHVCLKDALLNPAISTNKLAFSNYIAECRSKIPYPAPTNIVSFFTPARGEGDKAFNVIDKAIERSEKVWLAVHHLSHTGILASMARFRASASYGGDSLRLVADDDLFWADWAKTRNLKFGGTNTQDEYLKAKKIFSDDEMRFVETSSKEHRLHHNKFMVFAFPESDALSGAVFAGAGNFTNTGFKRNFENFYYITIPEVVAAFNQQYEYMWDTLSTKQGDLPTTFRFKVAGEGERVPY